MKATKGMKVMKSMKSVSAKKAIKKAPAARPRPRSQAIALRRRIAARRLVVCRLGSVPMQTLPISTGREARRLVGKARVFFIAGVMKGGTVTLGSHAGCHPELHMPWYEPHFFDEDDTFAGGPKAFADLFWDAAPSTRWFGDCTPSYLYMPQALHRASQYFPNARIIVLLRNPIDRAFSHHNHDVSKGRDVGTIQRRWRWELQQAHQAPWRGACRMDLLGRGFYAHQLRRLFASFHRRSILILISERFRVRPNWTLRRVASFLGVKALPSWAESAPPLEEMHVRSRWLSPLTVAQRMELRDIYSEDVSDLKEILGDDLPEWGDFAV